MSETKEAKSNPSIISLRQQACLRIRVEMQQNSLYLSTDEVSKPQCVTALEKDSC